MITQNTDFTYQQPLKTMYLSTLDDQKLRRPQTAVRDSLKVDDISGTRPKFLQKPIKPRQTFNNRNDDIAKSKPKVLIPTEVNRPVYNTYVDDIDGTRSKMNKFTTTRNTNPLNPVYELPQVEYYPVEQPKFIRDNLVIYDIQGTSAKETFAMKLEKEGKLLNTKDEILKSIQLKKKNHLRKQPNLQLLDVSDINCKQSKIKGNRVTNPLDPVYHLPNGQQKGSYLYGSIEKSKPQQLKSRQSNVNFSLSTSDIQGAKAKVNNFIRPQKTQIQQAKPDSMKRGISSNRKTNPLNPSYKYPGWSEVQTVSFQRPKTAHQKFDAFIGK